MGKFFSVFYRDVYQNLFIRYLMLGTAVLFALYVFLTILLKTNEQARLASLTFDNHQLSLTNYFHDKQKFPKSLHVLACAKFWQKNNCPQVLFENRADQHLWPEFLVNADSLLHLKHVLLVVSFNFPNYKAAAKTRALYRRLFADIIYCGPGTDKKSFWPIDNRARDNGSMLAIPSDSTFIAYGEQNVYISGETFYHCTPLVYEKIKNSTLYNNNKLKGVLFLSDDVVLNVWMLKALGKRLDANWMMHDNDDHIFDIDTTKFCFGWRVEAFGRNCSGWRDWHGATFYRRNGINFYEELTKLAKNSRGNDSYIWRDFYANLTRITKGKRRLLGNESADLYYIAKQYLPDFSRIFALFNKHKVFVETAVVSVLKTMTPPDSLQLINAVGHDNGNGYLREHSLEDVYTSRMEMLHPLKTASLDLQWEKLASPSDRSTGCVYCNILHLVNKYADILGLPT